MCLVYIGVDHSEEYLWEFVLQKLSRHGVHTFLF